MDARDTIISNLSELSRGDIESLIVPTELAASAYSSSSNPSGKCCSNGSSCITDACKPGNSDGVSFLAHKYEGEEDFDWLSPLDDDDTLIYGASNFCIADPFLLMSNPQSLLGYEPMKLPEEGSTEKDDHIVKGGGIIIKSMQSSSSNSSNGSALGDVSTMPPALSVPVGRARSKRPRLRGAVGSAGRRGNCMLWSSAAYIFKNTNSTDANIPDHGAGANTFSSGFAPREENEGIDGNSDYNGLISSQCHTDDDDDENDIAASKNLKWEKTLNLEEEGGEEPNVRRCTHCLSNKTPQWRAGPAGPKTLCNACGVRFKSGRLFDEYRPAKSPTFSSHKHSNSHRKVLEMRRKKGLQLQRSDDHSPSSSSSTSFLSTKPRIELKSRGNGFKKLKFKPHGDEIAPHLPDIVLIDPPTLDTPDFIQ